MTKILQMFKHLYIWLVCMIMNNNIFLCSLNDNGTYLRAHRGVPGVVVGLIEAGGRDWRPVLLVAVAHRVHRVHGDCSLHVARGFVACLHQAGCHMFPP